MAELRKKRPAPHPSMSPPPALSEGQEAYFATLATIDPSPSMKSHIDHAKATLARRHAAQEEEIEHLAGLLARSMPGWNDDTTEPDVADERTRAGLEAHWRRVNEACLTEARTYARIAIENGYTRH